MTARGDEIVAREAPGKGQAGIAVLRGNDRVQLLGERDGWSEIRLPDGRRAWVPATELVHVSDAAKPPVPTASSTPSEATLAEPSPDAHASLAMEIARLRALVDELETWRREASQRSEAPVSVPDGALWMVGGVALVVGVFVGGAWERHRSRRERSLRF